jgi:hypothetical protein
MMLDAIFGPGTWDFVTSVFVLVIFYAGGHLITLTKRVARLQERSDAVEYRLKYLLEQQGKP